MRARPRTMGTPMAITGTKGRMGEDCDPTEPRTVYRTIPTNMTWSHFLLALAVMAIWGTNFVVIRWGLGEFPPLAFAGLRFFFSAVPALFFLKLPATPWRYLVAYGVLLGAGQFGLLFIAMNGHISPGL